MEKTSETPMDKGRKPNETQESRVEEKYYYCCKQQQQYWRGKEDCCCCCSDFGFGE
ncbi:conserved domain protein [Bacteroides ovatus SD CMC 3f]|nr:conserved domain protein [Bacteroides ovatus SD CMC 3f]